MKYTKPDLDRYWENCKLYGKNINELHFALTRQRFIKYIEI